MNWKMTLGVCLAQPRRCRRRREAAPNLHVAHGVRRQPRRCGQHPRARLRRQPCTGLFRRPLHQRLRLYRPALAIDAVRKADDAHRCAAAPTSPLAARARRRPRRSADLVEQLARSMPVSARPARAVDADAACYVLNFGGNDVFAARSQDGTPTGYASDSAFLKDGGDRLCQRRRPTLRRSRRAELPDHRLPGARPRTGLARSLEAEGVSDRGALRAEHSPTARRCSASAISISSSGCRPIRARSACPSR